MKDVVNETKRIKREKKKVEKIRKTTGFHGGNTRKYLLNRRKVSSIF